VIVVMNLTSGEKKITHQIDHRYGIADPEFVLTIGALLGPALLRGNRITPLYNGDQIFPAMLEAIRRAERSICFETYIYWSGSIGREFSDALAERAQAGVRVHVMLDWIGAAKMEERLIQRMIDAGVEVEKFHPLRWYSLHRLNNRTHRKILVVDGRVGFTGGVGIADVWLGNAQDSDHWRDTHFRLEGPAVAQMQAAFMDHWIATRSLVLHGDDYFPQLEPAGDMNAQVFRSGSDDGAESVRLMYLLSLSAAERNIRLASAYFVPDDLSVATLLAARRRGVEIDIIVPGRHTDAAIVRRASRARWGRLLEAGIRIYEYQPTMYHCKVLVVDDCWTSVGSTNFDNRSFRLNDELNVNALDAGVAREQSRAFAADLKVSREIPLEAWRTRPLGEKLTERLAELLRNQL
jgi:cardiolipin synthase A/B